MSRTLILVASLFFACLGCTGAPEGTWSAALATTDAWVGVTVLDDDAVAYVCGAGDTLGSHTRWMYVEADGADLVFERDGWRLEVKVQTEQVKGQLLAPDGTAHALALQPRDGQPRVSDIAGLYTALDAGCRAGLIIASSTAEGEVSARGAWCDSFGFVAQVTPVSPVRETLHGITVAADTPFGFRSFSVAPLAPGDLAP